MRKRISPFLLLAAMTGIGTGNTVNANTVNTNVTIQKGTASSLHFKHCKGKKHASQKSRANRRK